MSNEDKIDAMRHAEIEALVDVQISLMSLNKTIEEQRDDTLDMVNERLTELKERENSK